MYAFANSHEAACAAARGAAQGFLDKLNEQFLFPLIILLLSTAFLMFLYGGFQFIRGASDPAARETGRKHMIYGIIGLLVMVSAATILAIAAASFGDLEQAC